MSPTPRSCLLRHCVAALLGVALVFCAAESASAQALNLQISTATLPDGATFKLQDRVPWAATIQPVNAAFTGTAVFVAYVTGQDIYGNPIYIEVGRGDIPNIDDGGTFQIREQFWTIPNDGTLFNMEQPGLQFVISLFPTAPTATPPNLGPTTLAEITAAAANPLRTRTGRFFVDVIPDLAVAAPGVTYRPGEYRGGDVVRFVTSWGNRTVGERPLSSRPLRPRDRYSASLHLSENGAFYSGAAPTPSPSPSPSPTPSDPDSALGATDSVNDDFKLMAIIFSGDLAGILPNGSDQFRRVQVVGTPTGTGAWPAAGSMNPYGLNGVQATAVAVLSAGSVTGINVSNGGGGYSVDNPPIVTIAGGGGSGATAEAVVSPAGVITAVNVVLPGSGYTSLPTVTIARNGSIIGTQRNYTPQPDDGFLDIGEGVILTSEQLVPRNFEGDYFVAMRLETASDAGTGNNVFVSNSANKITIDPSNDPELEPASAVSNQNGEFVQGGNAGSADGGISDTGTVVFSSRSSNLLVPPTQAGPTVPPQFATSKNQIFLKLRDTREVLLASRTAAGVQANADCFDPFISADGRYVAFHSVATNLVEENTGGGSMIYVYDTVTRETVVVSRNAVGALANGDSFNASLSASGRFVAFESVASNLDAPIVQPNISTSGSTIGQIRSYSVLSGGSGYQPNAQFEVTLVGGSGSGARARAIAGPDGNIISVSPIVPNYGGGYLASDPPTVVVPPSPQIFPPLAGQGQVYLHDRNVDGRVDADGNAVFDEPGNTRTYLVSADENAFGEWAQISDNLSFQPAVNANDTAADIADNGGMFVAFSSYASNLPQGSGYAMVYRAKVDVANQAGVVAMKAASVNNVGSAADWLLDDTVVPFSLQPSISGDGSQVAFTSWSDNLVYDPFSVPAGYTGDTNGVQDVFVRNFRIDTGANDSRATVRVSVSEEKVATGTIFFTAPPPTVPPTPGSIPNGQPATGDTLTISTGTVTHDFVFYNPSGPPPLLPAGQSAVPIGTVLDPNDVWTTRDNLLTAISTSPLRPATGPTIEAVETTPPDAAAPGTGYVAGIYLKNTSRGTGGNVAILVRGATGPAVPINLLVGGGANRTIFGSGMSGGGTQAEDNPRAVQGVPFGSNEPSIDRSGRYVTFRTIAGNLDVYLNDASRAYYNPPDPITGELTRPLLTAGSAASNVYIHDRNARDQRGGDELPIFDLPFDPATREEFITTRRVSVNRFAYPTYVTGTQEGGVNANSSANSSDPFISPNGRYVVFTSTAPGEGGLIFGPNNLTPLDNASLPDVFLADLGTLGDAPPPVDSRPSVTILSPPDGLVVSPQTLVPVYATAFAKGDKSLVSAELLVNNVSQGVLDAEPYAWSYTVPSTGTFVFRVVVTDSKGLSRDASSVVKCEPPQAGAPLIEILQPTGALDFAAGSTFFINGRISATSPAQIVPSTVSFTVNGVPISGEIGVLGNKYGVLYTPSTPNTVANLRVVASDSLNRTGFSPPIVSRVDQVRTALPEVRMRPVVQATPVTAKSTVQLQAEVLFFGASSDEDSADRGVEFYVNNVFVGRATAAGPAGGGRTLYVFDWETPEIIDSAPGPLVYSLRARALEANGSVADEVTGYVSSVSAPTPLTVFYVPTNPAPGSNEAFIIDNFEKIFFREPNFDEYQEYLDLFAAGLSQSQIIESMLKSSEFAEFQQVLLGYYLRMGLSPGNWTPTSRASLDTLLNYLDVMRSANGRTLLPAAMSAGLAEDVTNLPQPYGATLGQAQVASALLNTPTLTTGAVRVSNLQNQAFRDWMLRTFNVPYLPTALPVGQTVAWQGDQATMLTTIAGPYPTAGATAIQRYGANYAFISAMYAAINEGRMNPAMKPWLTAFPGLVRGIAFQYLYKGTWNTSAPAATAAEIAKNLVPGITSPAVVNSRVGTAVSYQITTQNAAVIPPYAATGLPPGLALNTTTGLITGTPTAAGEFKALLSATNANGTGTKQVTFTIIAPAPAISNQAINANVGDGVEYQIASTPDPNVYPTTYNLAGGINQIRVTDLGAGYASAPTVAISGGGGSGAAATAVLGAGANLGKVVAVNITNPGSGYTSNPQIALSGGGGSGAKAAAYVLPQGLSFNKSGGLISGSLASGSEGNYSLKMTVQNSGGSATADLTINVTLPSAMTTWLASYGITARGLDLGGDPDRDGASYYDEFAFGTDPTELDRNPRTVTRVPGKVTILWMGRKDGSADYTIEGSESMASASWSAMSIVSPPAGVVVTRPVSGPAHDRQPSAYEWIRVEIDVPSNQQSGFYKVKAAIKPSAL
jgi:hypothetical protein